MKPTPAVQILNFTADRLAGHLTKTGTGRVALHVLCLFRHPGRLRWHWQGIARELCHIFAVTILVSLAWPSRAEAPRFGSDSGAGPAAQMLCLTAATTPSTTDAI